MSTKAKSLPQRNLLELTVTGFQARYLRDPRPLWQINFRVLIHNTSSSSVRLAGRKWILEDERKQTRIIEAAQVFNQQPVLVQGAVFSYAGYQVFEAVPTRMEIRFFGVDQQNSPFITPPLAFHSIPD